MRRVLAALAVLMFAAGCGKAAPVATPRPSGDATVPPSPALAAFYGQQLAWQGCGKAECADLSVPLDYAKPDGARIKVAVLRIPAKDQAHKLGALLVNPGGPGGSGVEFVSRATGYFGTAVVSRFDLVGFDPRGVGGSTPLKCGDTALTDALLAADPQAKTAADRARSDDLVRRFGEACVANSGELASHISTDEAARDMDVLRAALRQPTLDYFGASYGTFLGATYANLFPAKVGRMVLDGAVDPKLSTVDMVLAQARGFEDELRAYAADCVAHGADCSLGGSPDAVVKRIQELLDQIEAAPLPTSTGRQLTIGLALLGIWQPLYEKSSWGNLTSALTEATERHVGTQLLQAADFYASRGPNSYLDNSIAVLDDVNCLDHDEQIQPDQVDQYLPQFLAAAPTFGRAFANSLASCALWPIKSGRHSTAMRAQGASPILVLGTTHDPATPIEWARGLAAELSSGVLVTRDGDGHTAYHQQNRCIDSTVEDYFTRGSVPATGKSC